MMSCMFVCVSPLLASRQPCFLVVGVMTWEPRSLGDIKIQSAMSKEEEEYSSVIGCKVAPMTKL